MRARRAKAGRLSAGETPLLRILTGVRTGTLALVLLVPSMLPAEISAAGEWVMWGRQTFSSKRGASQSVSPINPYPTQQECESAIGPLVDSTFPEMVAKEAREGNRVVKVNRGFTIILSATSEEVETKMECWPIGFDPKAR